MKQKQVKIKQFRIAAGITQLEMSKIMDISQPEISKWESKTFKLPLAKINVYVQLAKRYNYPLTALDILNDYKN